MWIAALALGALAAGPTGEASAQVGLAVGPVLQDSELGVRGGLDSGLLLVAAERYALDDGPRTRGELALRVSVRLTRRLRLEPQIGIIPFDYFDSALEDRFAFSASGTIRLAVKLTGPLALALEPLRLEARMFQVTIPDGRPDNTHTDRDTTWLAGGWVALRVGY